MSTIFKTYFDNEHHFWKSTFKGTSEFLCGLELEIEDIKDTSAVHDTDLSMWIVQEEDNSLRNHGLEFKFSPATLEDQLQRVTKFLKLLKTGPKPYSERTSIHVHVNALSFSLQKARQFVLTYALVEPLFFKFVGPERQNNIFCVPLNYTFLPNLYKNDFVKLLGNWHKYTAFNILPAKHLGTFEFRHLYGTKDMKIIALWLTTLKELYDFVQNLPEDEIILSLIQKVNINELVKAIVPSLYSYLGVYNVSNLLQDSILDVKLSSGGYNK